MPSSFSQCFVIIAVAVVTEFSSLHVASGTGSYASVSPENVSRCFGEDSASVASSLGKEVFSSSIERVTLVVRAGSWGGPDCAEALSFGMDDRVGRV